jgi:hypothetical protein
VYANAHVKRRRLAYVEIVNACPDLFDMDCSPFVFAQAVLCVMGFPTRMTFAVDCLGPPPEAQVYHLVDLARASLTFRDLHIYSLSSICSSIFRSLSSAFLELARVSSSFDALGFFLKPDLFGGATQLARQANADTQIIDGNSLGGEKSVSEYRWRRYTMSGYSNVIVGSFSSKSGSLSPTAPWSPFEQRDTWCPITELASSPTIISETN